MGRSSIYRIKIRGVVPDTWLDRLGGMQVAAGDDGEAIIEGVLPDQAALLGVLNTLYQLRLPLIEVSCMGLLQGKSREKSE